MAHELAHVVQQGGDMFHKCEMHIQRQSADEDKIGLGGVVDCDVTQSGQADVRMFDNSCVAPCIREHEEKHAADMKSCCLKFQKAYRKARFESEGGIREEIYLSKLYQIAFGMWKDSNRAWKEMVAFNEMFEDDGNGNCFDRLRMENKCSENQESQCCREIDKQEKIAQKQLKFYMENFSPSSLVGCDVEFLLREAEKRWPRPERMDEPVSLIKEDEFIEIMDNKIHENLLNSVNEIE